MVHIASSHQPGLHSETLHLRKERWGWICVKSKRTEISFSYVCIHGCQSVHMWVSRCAYVGVQVLHTWVSRCTYMGVQVCIHGCPGMHSWVSRCTDVCTWVSGCMYIVFRYLQMCMCLQRLEVDGRWLPEMTSPLIVSDSFLLNWTYQLGQTGWPSYPWSSFVSTSLVLGFQVQATCPALCMGSERPTEGPHSCAARASQTWL